MKKYTSGAMKHKNQGMILVTVLMTISVFTLLLSAATAELILMMRSHQAYWAASEGIRHCEQWAANMAARQDMTSIKSQEQLLNVKPCAMVLTEPQGPYYVARFLYMRTELNQPKGVCEVVIATLDKTSVCLTQVMKLQPGIQSWRWLAAP